MIHLAQPVSQQPHHVERKSWGLPNEKKESFFIDFREGALPRCHYRYASLSVINEGHFADDSPAGTASKVTLPSPHANPSRQNHIHTPGRIAFFEQRFTRFECHDIAFVAEKAEEIRFAVVHGLPAV